jgi:hypothetical protein
MSKPMWVVFSTFIAAALVVAWKFGGLGIDQFVALFKMLIGWTLWTAAIAIAYAGLERFFPGVLCARATDEPKPQADAT